MRYPDFLKKNGTIGFVAPSFGCSTEPYRSAFDKAQEVFRRKGYKLQLGPNCYEGKGIGISNTPELCGKELNDMYSDETNDVLISCGGGELMCRSVEHVDFEKIKAAKPKWYMGYSDNTNFIFPLTTIADVAGIYGPNVPPFSIELNGHWQESIEDAFAVLSGEKTVFKGYEKWEKEDLESPDGRYMPINATEPRVLKANTEKASFSGRLIGGCLDVLQILVGTRLDKVDAFAERYKADGFIWFLEACDLTPLGVARALWQLRNAGWFKYVKGFLIGRPYNFGQEIMGLNMYDAVLQELSSFGVPIIMDLDIGHLPPQIPIVSGALTDVEYCRQDIELRYHYI